MNRYDCLRKTPQWLTGNTHIHLLPDVFEGNGVMHAFNGNMVVRPHGSNFPYRQLIWMRRQRAQKWQFFCKCAGSAAFTLLERLVIETLHAIPDGLIQLRQGQKLPVSQCCEDIRGNDTYSTFHGCLIPGCSYTRRHDGSFIMFGQFLIRLVQYNFATAVFFYTGFQVVALNHSGNAAKVTICIDVSLRPGLLIHGKKRLPHSCSRCTGGWPQKRRPG